MNDLGIWIHFIFVHSWKTVKSHLTGNWHPAGGHMSGFGNGIELVMCYLAVLAQLVVLITAGLIFR